jgi:hypothetical protein
MPACCDGEPAAESERLHTRYGNTFATKRERLGDTPRETEDRQTIATTVLVFSHVCAFEKDTYGGFKIKFEIDIDTETILRLNLNIKNILNNHTPMSPQFTTHHHHPTTFTTLPPLRPPCDHGVWCPSMQA